MLIIIPHFFENKNNEIFDLFFIHQSTPPGTLILFEYRFLFAEKCDFIIVDVVVIGVNDTADQW
jgi:hypothetical protein